MPCLIITARSSLKTRNLNNSFVPGFNDRIIYVHIIIDYSFFLCLNFLIVHNILRFGEVGCYFVCCYTSIDKHNQVAQTCILVGPAQVGGGAA